MENIIPNGNAVLLGRVWNAEVQGPSIITIRDTDVYDITSRDAPTLRGHL